MQTDPDQHFEVAIIGAGFSGLGMAMALKQDGIDDFVVLERAADLGGTWTRPGATRRCGRGACVPTAGA